MKRFRLQKGIGLLILVLAVLLISGSAWASVLNPGDYASPVDNVASLPAGTILNQIDGTFIGKDFFGNVFISGTYTTGVLAEGGLGGTLDFFYQASTGTKEIPSPNTIKRLTTVDFLGFSTDAYYVTDGGVIPQSVDRDISGSTVGFSFLPGFIPNGAVSAMMFIKTNAYSYVNGSMSLIDGGSVSVPGFAPTVPEPGTLLLLGSGLVSLAFYVRRRKI